MRVFVAGASGAIGIPVISALLRRNHTVIGMTNSAGGVQKLQQLGASAVSVDALDAEAVLKAVADARPDVIVNELTALPKNPAELATAQVFDRKLRLAGTSNLQRAAQQHGVQRFIQQSSGFYLQAKPEPADESAPLAVHASPGVAASSRMYQELETEVLGSTVAGVVLRYGFLYGPGTWYEPNGGSASAARAGQLPIVDGASAKWCFVHVDDAAEATAASITAAPGTYNVVDDDPSPIGIWLPGFARAMGAPEPQRISLAEAKAQGGDDAVFYATGLCAASNAKAKRELQWTPRRLEWLTSTTRTS